MHGALDKIGCVAVIEAETSVAASSGIVLIGSVVRECGGSV
jgi:hypothetical protein